MHSVLRTFSCVVFAGFLVACGQPHDSRLNGHYEDAEEQAMEVFRGKQRVQPEYAKTDAVIVSSQLISLYRREDLIKALDDAGVKKIYVITTRGSGENVDSPSMQRLRQVMGAGFQKVQILEQKDKGSTTVWARDWSPLGAVSSDRSLHLLDLNYYPRRPADDATSRALSAVTAAKRVSVPVYNEGGNFMLNTRGQCFMSSRVTEANDSVLKSGDKILDATEVAAYYKDFAGCRDVSIMPRMPEEGTGHIDMWAKFINDDTVILGEMSDEVLATLTAYSRSFALTIRDYLNERADEIRQKGLNVLRIPMPVPSGSMFRSYTNSLIVNGYALVPQYRQSMSARYEDQDFLVKYESRVREIYEAAGYRVVFVPSDAMIQSGGAVHCVTMQLPSVL